MEDKELPTLHSHHNMAADDLAMIGARSSVDMVLT